MDTIEVEKGYTLTFFHSRGNATSENSPYTGVGMCGGYALTTPDGKTKLAGICTRQGKDGSWSDAWSKDASAERGEWHQVAGTGVYAAKIGTKRVGGSPRLPMTRPTWAIGVPIASKVTTRLLQRAGLRAGPFRLSDAFPFQCTG